MDCIKLQEKIYELQEENESLRLQVEFMESELKARDEMLEEMDLSMIAVLEREAKVMEN